MSVSAPPARPVLSAVRSAEDVVDSVEDEDARDEGVPRAEVAGHERSHDFFARSSPSRFAFVTAKSL